MDLPNDYAADYRSYHQNIFYATNLLEDLEQPTLMINEWEKAKKEAERQQAEKKKAAEKEKERLRRKEIQRRNDLNTPKRQGSSQTHGNRPQPNNPTNSTKQNLNGHQNQPDHGEGGALGGKAGMAQPDAASNPTDDGTTQSNANLNQATTNSHNPDAYAVVKSPALIAMQLSNANFLNSHNSPNHLGQATTQYNFVEETTQQPTTAQPQTAPNPLTTYQLSPHPAATPPTHPHQQQLILTIARALEQYLGLY